MNNREDLIKHARRNSHLSFEALLASLGEENKKLWKPRLESDLVAIAEWATKLPSSRNPSTGVLYGGAQTREERAAMWKSVERRKERDLDLFLYRQPEGVTVEQVMDFLDVTRPTALKRLNRAGIVRSRVGHYFVYQQKGISLGKHIDVTRVRAQLRKIIGDVVNAPNRRTPPNHPPIEPKPDPRQRATVYLKSDTEIELTVLTEPESVWYHRRRGKRSSYLYLQCAGEGCAACHAPAPTESPALEYRLCQVEITEDEARRQAEAERRAARRAPAVELGRTRWLRYREWLTDPEPTLGRGVWVREGKGKDTRYGWLGVTELMQVWWAAA